jgi:hypothetical protein
LRYLLSELQRMQRKGESYLTPPLSWNAFGVLTYSGASAIW